MTAKAAPFPSKEEIVAFIRENQGEVGKREIARAFRLSGDQRTILKRILKELEAEGTLARDRSRRYKQPGQLPNVAVIEISGTDVDGDTIARPAAWDGPGTPPLIYVAPEKRSRSGFATGERALARLSPIGPGTYEARIIRRLLAAPPRTLGLYTLVAGQGRILPVDKRAREELVVAPGDAGDADPGDLVWAEVRTARPLGLKQARIVERLGPSMGARSITLITLHDHDIPSRFSEATLAEAEAARAAPLDDRDDLRRLPLVTIDGEDARDFDDAVFAEPDTDPDNPGGWHLLVAIADVAWYVQPGSALDRTAFERGNSVYFPDRVVPMLPQQLSNGWCSLVPGEDRPCLAVHLWIDAGGNLRRRSFVRGLMRSAARLTYRQVEAARHGDTDETTARLARSVIAPLYGAYQALAEARHKRGVLELDVPERQVRVDADGHVTAIHLRERLESHKLIEEFMILANVAAAEALEERKTPCVYRVHDQPSADKLEALRDFLDTVGLSLRPGRMTRPGDFNGILSRVEGTPVAPLVNEVVLRSQAQACYDTVNIGHFGLALRRYCHFTSPIRRYADLLVHRALIEAFKLGRGRLGADPPDLARAAEHISATERRAAAAERDAVDRFTAAFLAERVGATFAGRIGGVTRFGLFVALDGTGAQGLVPIASLPDDYYAHDARGHRLVGQTHGLTFRLGDKVEVRLVEVSPLTGGIIMEILGGVREGGTLGPRRRPASKGRPPPARSRRPRPGARER
ncbi:MAG: ribonuclease R [Rhodospirillales bacterium]